MLHRVQPWARSILLRRRLEREMQAEMAQHLDRSVERLMARGLTESEARREAVREFGNVPLLQEQARDARGAAWMGALLADWRFAVRHFARRPGVTLAMLVVLVAGMSISTLLFTYVHAYAVRPPPGVALADDLVRIRGSRDAGLGGRGFRTFAEEEFLEYRRLPGVFRAVAGWTDATVTLAVPTDAERRGLEARATFVTENYFSVLAVRPRLGPGLPAAGTDDASRAATAVISHSTWDQLFARDEEAIGATLVVNGVSVTIVGVAPERFTGFPGYSSLQLWLPRGARPLVLPGQPREDFRAVARLRAGVGLREASAAVAAVAGRTVDSTGQQRIADPSADVVPLLSANSDPMFDRDVRLMTLSVGLLGLLVLLVTCTNVSALLTGLATARRQEITIRLSLGGSRARLVRQLLSESALLASIAAAAALACVWALLHLAATRIPALPFEVGLGWPAIFFTFGIALAVGVLFGISPALHATRLGLATALRDSSGSIAAVRGRLQRSLVVAQIALTQPLTVVLAALLLFLTTQFDVRRTALADRLVSVAPRSATLTSNSSVTAASTQRLRASARTLRDRIERMSGVEGASIAWGGGVTEGPYVAERAGGGGGATHSTVELAGRMVDANWFDVSGLRMLRGRGFERGEVVSGVQAGGIPTIIDASLARHLWGGADPIGRRLRPAADSSSAPALTVVGVIDDPASSTRKASQEVVVYLPPDTTRTPDEILVRASGPGQEIVPRIREVMQEVVPDLSARIRTRGEIEDMNVRMYRLVVSGVSVAGAAALLLSAIGLYAVVAFAVGQRTREIAVRMSVGARRGQVVQRFVGDGLRLTALGLLLGLPISLAGLRLLMSALGDELPRMALLPVTSVAALAIIVVAAAAAWIPARRAATIDPASALRSD